jgi:hypothetical protein
MPRPTAAVSIFRGFACVARDGCSPTPSTCCAGPTAEPGKWVGARWKSPWEREDLDQILTDVPAPPSQSRPATADRLAESSRVSQQEYARFYEVQTGSPPTPRVLAAFVASQSLGVDQRGARLEAASSRAAPTTAKQRRNQRVLESIGSTTRYKEPYPRPPRDPSGNDPRGGAAHTVFASRSARIPLRRAHRRFLCRCHGC